MYLRCIYIVVIKHMRLGYVIYVDMYDFRCMDSIYIYIYTYLMIESSLNMSLKGVLKTCEMLWKSFFEMAKLEFG